MFQPTFFMFRADEEGVSRQNVNKQMRELTNQLQELQEDLETEKEARNKAEKLKRDLNEVSCCVLYNKPIDIGPVFLWCQNVGYLR